MNEIAELALAFCRECYWAEVRGATIVGRSFICGRDNAVSMSISGTNILGHFDYGNLSGVMGAVREYLERLRTKDKDMFIQAGIQLSTAFQLFIQSHIDEKEFIGQCFQSCLEAAHKLKEAA